MNNYCYTQCVGPMDFKNAELVHVILIIIICLHGTFLWYILLPVPRPLGFLHCNVPFSESVSKSVSHVCATPVCVCALFNKL